MSKFLHHDNCPSCGSRDNLAVYDDGHSHCFGCGYTEKGNKKIETRERATDRLLTPLPMKQMPALKERGIDQASVNKYKVSVNTNPDNDIEAVFPLFDDSGQHVANQVRRAGKQFRCEGNLDTAGLFGQQAFQPGGKSITITEGFFDAMAVYQLTGSRYPSVGVMSASSAKKEVIRNFEYINSFSSVVINFDSDKPGQDAAKAVASLFQPGKIRILKLDKAKDANEYLINGWVKEFIDAWFRAPSYTPEGLRVGSDLWSDIINRRESFTVPYPFEGLNKLTFGLRLSELVTITADSGVGKTQVLKTIEHLLLTHEDIKKNGYGVGLMHLEESNGDTALGLISIHNGVPYHLPTIDRPEDDIRRAYDDLLNNNKFVLFDHFGSNDIHVILDKIRHMSAMGCKYIVIDHLSIIVSGNEGDERRQLDEITTKIKTLCMELDLAVIAVVHTNRNGQIRGTAGIEQLSNMVFRLERDKMDTNEWRRNITKFMVMKNRFSGYTGVACYLSYDKDTGLLSELSSEQAQDYEQGGSGAGQEFGTYRA